MQAVLPLLMHPTVPAPLGVGLLEDDSPIISSEAFLIFHLLFLFMFYLLCMRGKHSLSAGFVALLI
jgi:hypothetical protein